jgi:ribosomal protein S18 acetylase RimI-like enzyme
LWPTAARPPTAPAGFYTKHGYVEKGRTLDIPGGDEDVHLFKRLGDRPDTMDRMPEVVVPLIIRDLTAEDLPLCPWLASAPYRASVANGLERARRGEADYLAVCSPSGLPVALGGVVYAKVPGTGWLQHLEVHAALRSCGIGALLVEAAEQRIRARGLHRAELKVEESNPRARALYERLGYVAYGREPAAWDAASPDGSLTRYETVCTLMRKELPRP